VGHLKHVMERTLTCVLLKALIADRVSIALLDVRRRSPFEAEPRVIPGAVWKNPAQVESWAAELNPDRPIIVYCVHGHEVSNGVVDRLRERGFDAALLEGGIEAWKASGGPVTAWSGGTMS
jgi:rhodanese-related sulfurtransferase